MGRGRIVERLIVSCALAVALSACATGQRMDYSELTAALAETTFVGGNNGAPAGSYALPSGLAFGVAPARGEGRLALGGPKPRPEIELASAYMQCVPFARDLSGIQLKGDAVVWWGQAEGKYDRSARPQNGALLVLKGYRTDSRGHLAYVKRMLSRSEIVIDHANWLNDGKLHIDTPVKDVSPNHDWSLVKVWSVPAGRYGDRTYRVQGFILPDAEALALAAANRRKLGVSTTTIASAAPSGVTAQAPTIARAPAPATTPASAVVNVERALPPIQPAGFIR